MRGRNPNQRGRETSVRLGLAQRPTRSEEARVLEQLSPAAIAHWPIVARQLRDGGVLDAVDACSLASYCEAFARWCAAGEQVAKMLIDFGVRSGRRAQGETSASQNPSQSVVV